MAQDIPVRAVAADGLNTSKGQVISAHGVEPVLYSVPYVSGEDAHGNKLLTFALLADIPGSSDVTLPIAISDVTDLQTTLDSLQTQIDAVTGAGGYDANRNTWIGENALNSVTTGTDNTAVGYDALTAVVGGGARNTVVGAYAGAAATGTADQVLIGYEAGKALTTGSTGLIAIGSGAYKTRTTDVGEAIVIGYEALKSSTGNAQYSTIIGWRAGYSNTTNGIQGSTLVGFNAGYSLTTGSDNDGLGASVLGAATTGSYNVAIGRSALAALTTGEKNVAIGYAAGASNSLTWITTGSSNTLVGWASNPGSHAASYRTVLGAGATSTQDNTVILGRTTDDVGIGMTSPQGKLHVDGRFHLSEISANPAASDLTSGSNAKDRVAMYMKADKLVFAYNDGAGTVNYLTFTLDGATTTFTNSTTAP